MTDLKPLKDKTAIVTGAGRGIGMAIAKGFAKAGANAKFISKIGDERKYNRTKRKK